MSSCPLHGIKKFYFEYDLALYQFYTTQSQPSPLPVITGGVFRHDGRHPATVAAPQVVHYLILAVFYV